MATTAVLVPFHQLDGARAVVNATSSGSMTNGNTYRLEAQGGSIRIAEAASTPDPDAATPPAYMALSAGEVYWHSQGATENLYAWTIHPGNTPQLVVNEGA